MMKLRTYTLTKFLNLLLFLGLLASAPASALEKVTLQLNGYHQFQYAGYYAALEQGYYSEAGLDVAIVEFKMGIDPVIDVYSGKAEFGVSNSSLLLARAANKPVVALAAIGQHSANVLFGQPRGKEQKEQKEQGMQALTGKRIMLDTQADSVLALLANEGMAGQFVELTHSYDPQDLIKGKVDAMSGSLLNELYFFERAKFPAHIYAPRDAGIDFYGDVLFTSEHMVSGEGDKVRAFRAASLRGWQYAMAHQSEMVDLIRNKYAQRLDRDHLLFQGRQMQALMDLDSTEIGNQTAARWLAIGAAYLGMGKLEQVPSIDGFIFDPTPPPKKAGPDYKLLALIAAGALLIVLFLLVTFRLTRAQFALRIEKQRQEALQEQLRANEERYRGLFISMDNGFALNEIICDNDGKPIDYRFIEVNPAFEKVSGMPREKLIGKRAKEVLQSGDDDWLEQFGSVALTGQPKRYEKFSQKTCRWFATDSYSPAPGKFAVVTQEITERKQMEIALTKANIELRDKYEEISRLQEKLREQAVRDPLTGLHNRRYLDETLQRELARAKRESYTLCVILIDLDFFKKVNDTYGHLAGDEVLKAFARLLHDHARAGDVACRYGGEEFMLMLPKMPTETAIERANVLREKFAATKVPFGEAEISTTLSIGIAIFPQHGGNPDELTNNADQALYVAKSEGRNRAIVFDPGRPPAIHG
ncbi:PAS:GGDEF protein [Sterolibacterium denitrificans]|uniref:diguanylate cyclase n=1 Tax=Sterolibacterium denitrificans TaxID=157592 RepID=A0A7Z7HQC6_9PROT|nr:diguanylate cyclase [Sterolibacterium denitrificans]SMB24796.1 PAS:GGDEF protein [Sterolibacterium denitrificans]